MNRVPAIVLVLVILSGASVAAQDRPVVPLKTALHVAAEAEGYRLLYRDELVAGVTVPSSATSLAQIAQALQSAPVALSIDHARRIAVVIERRGPAAAAREIRLEGRVVDAETGVALPHASITWTVEDVRRGIAADSDGHFRLALRQPVPEAVIVSFVGYAPGSITISEDLAAYAQVDLIPLASRGKEVIVTGMRTRSNLDSSLAVLSRPSLFAPFGESNVIRSLSILPSMAITAAASEGLIVRGSPSDGLLVTLDGVTMFNHAHLFGLFDAFNVDAIETAAFYYDVAPAAQATGAGGVLAYDSARPSLTQRRAVGAVTNSATRVLLQTPILSGRSAVMVAGRHSNFFEVPGFQTSSLLGHVFAIDRATSLTPPAFRDERKQADSRFFDLHSTLVHDLGRIGSVSISGYLGGTDASLSTQVVNALPPAGSSAASHHLWNARSASLRSTTLVNGFTVLRTTFGYSSYDTDYSITDFPFQQQRPFGSSREAGWFANQSAVEEFSAVAEVIRAADGHSVYTFGAGSYRINSRYREESDDRPRYELRQESIRSDVFVQVDTQPAPGLELQGGLRAHHYTAGNLFMAAPRARLTYTLGRVSAGAAAGRSYQFIHRLSLPDAGAPSFWIQNRPNEGPTRADMVSSTVQIGHSNLVWQIEGYIKRMSGVRDHELGTTFSSTQRDPDSPLISDLTGIARGWENSLRLRHGPAVLSAAYTLSKTDMRGPEGVVFAPPWDRRHTFVGSGVLDLSSRIALDATWMIASGALDRVSVPAGRLPVYHRLDVAIRAEPLRHLTMTLAVFNVYDRQNVWYRQEVEQSGWLPRPGAGATADIFDLGFRPSFEITLSL